MTATSEVDGRSQGTDGSGELLPSNPSLGGGLYDPSEACDSEEDEQAPKRQKTGDTQAQHDAEAVGCVANGGGRGNGQGGEGGGRVGTVLVWDLDETLICFNSLLTSSFPMGSQGTAEDAALLHFAEELETLLYAVIEVPIPHPRAVSGGGEGGLLGWRGQAQLEPRAWTFPPDTGHQALPDEADFRTCRPQGSSTEDLSLPSSG